VSKVSGQTGATILYENVLSIFSRHASPTTAVWVCNPGTIPALFSVSVDVGAAGSVVPMVTVGPDGSMYILGRPLLQSHRCPVLGTAGDIGLYSFEWYYCGLRKGMAIEKSGHVGFTKNQSTWRLITRVDGAPKISSPMTGSDSR